MLSKISGKPALIRDINRSMILENIEKEGPISRADISRLTKISSPTVSLVVEHFLKKGALFSCLQFVSLISNKAILS